jgi:hypothetical protein
MLVNMSLSRDKQPNSCINQSNGTVASFHGMFASKILFSSPTSVSVLKP